ncbi:MAG: FAD-dependent oxidoreductase [Micropruina sp.]
MSSERRAVIVGAGIAGLTCALALARRSWRVTVLERAAELGEVGAGISLWPRAMAILDDLGVTQRMDGAYAFSVQAGLRRPDGRMLIDVQGGTGRGPVMVHRARLHAALTGGLDGVEVLTSATVVSSRRTRRGPRGDLRRSRPHRRPGDRRGRSGAARPARYCTARADPSGTPATRRTAGSPRSPRPPVARPGDGVPGSATFCCPALGRTGTRS